MPKDLGIYMFFLGGKTDFALKILNNLQLFNLAIWAKKNQGKRSEYEEVQGGPQPVVTGVIAPISRVIAPVTHLFSAIYRGYNSIYNW